MNSSLSTPKRKKKKVKHVRLFIFCVFTAALILVGKQFISIVNENEYLKLTFSFMYESLMSPTNSYNIISREEGASLDVTVSTRELWRTEVPQNIKDLLMDSGWKIIISESDITTRFNSPFDISGITVSTIIDDKYIWGSGRIYFENNFKQIKHSLLHEIGHAVDATYDCLSSSEEWLNIYEIEKSNFKNSSGLDDLYLTSSPNEYFAAVFNEFLKDGYTLQKNTPESYAYMSKILEQKSIK